jgi:hypothetical protein
MSMGQISKESKKQQVANSVSEEPLGHDLPEISNRTGLSAYITIVQVKEPRMNSLDWLSC